MHEGLDTSSMPRREFLGYCGATASLIATAAASWAEQPTALSAEQTANALHALAGQLEGDLLLPDNERFEPMRGISWNRMLPDRRPDLIVMAQSQADVVATLRFADQQKRRIAVRGGGHNWVASSVRQGSILLDLSRMNSIEIDAASATATIGPAVQGAVLLDHAAKHGLAFPVAHCPTVALSGFLLSGGHGWNFNRWGSACSNVTAVDLVLADGRELTATSEQHADLFWAVRGAGAGFFGVVTRYELKLHRLPQAITMSTYIFPRAAIAAASALMDDLRGKLTRDVELFMSIGAPPPDLANDNEVVGVVGAVAFADSATDAKHVLKPLNADQRVRQAVLSTVNCPMDFNALLGMAGGLLPGGHRFLVDNIWSDAPLVEMLAGSADHYAGAPSTKSHLLAINLHPKFELKGTAHSMHKQYLVYNNTVWADREDDETNRAWHASATALLELFKAGRYIAEADLGKEANVARQCYTPEAWTRLRELRATYDPDGRFCDYLGTG